MESKKEYCKVTVHWENGGKSSAPDTRVLTFYCDRFDILVPTKSAQLRFDRCVPYLDLRRMQVADTNPSRMLMILASGDLLLFNCSLEADCARIAAHVISSLRCHLPQLVPQAQPLLQSQQRVRCGLASLAEVSLPSAWNTELLVEEHTAAAGDLICRSRSEKCGHFAAAYGLFADYMGSSVQDEIKWDVETIYFSLGTRTFCLGDFAHFGPADWAAVLGALAFNDHFTGLNCSGVKFVS